MIVIGTPTRDLVYAGFAFDLAQLIRNTPEAVFSVVQGTLLCNLRSLLVKTSIQNKASHILFIDSDMRFPANTVQQLLARNVDIIGANCKQRQTNQWTARKAGEFISSESKSGIEEVDTLGFGVTFIKTSVFEKMTQPWFATPWDGNKHVGEDVYFCTMAAEVGFKIHVDHDLSQQIKHAGLVEFGV